MGVKAHQYTLFLLNFLLFVFGWILIITGSVINSMPDMIKSGYVQGTSIFLIVIGCLVVIVSIIGFLGASQKNICLLLFFVSLAFVLFVMCVICLIIGFSLRQNTNDEVLEEMRHDINGTDSLEYIEHIQEIHECCGIDSWMDWRNNPSFKPPTKSLPLTCCKFDAGYCNENLPSLNLKGCKEPYKQAVKDNLKVLAAIATACAIFLVIVMAASLMMVQAIRAEYNAV